jgi:hypothetical protein
MDNPNQRCTCGDTGVQYYPAENQHEPNCWDCYYQMRDSFNPRPETVTSSDDDLPF